MSDSLVVPVLLDAVMVWCRSRWWRGVWAWRGGFGVRVFRLFRGALEFRLHVYCDVGYEYGSVLECILNPFTPVKSGDGRMPYFGGEVIVGVLVVCLEDRGSVDEMLEFVLLSLRY